MNTHPEWLTKAIEGQTADLRGANNMKPIAGRYIVQRTSCTHEFQNEQTGEWVAFVPYILHTWAVLDVTMRDENGCWLIIKNGFATAKAAKEFINGLVK